MAYSILPFPGTSGSGPYYSAQLWAAMFAKSKGVGAELAHAGVVEDHNWGLFVQPQSPTPTMTVEVRPGAALIKGRWAESDAQVNLTLSAADPTYNRYDLVVFRSDSTNKTCVIAAKTGTASASPTPPALDQTDAPYYEIPLAQVLVAAGATLIGSQQITDLRRFTNQAQRVVVPAYINGTVTYGTPCVWSQDVAPSSVMHPERILQVEALSSSTYTKPFAGFALGNYTDELGLLLQRGPLALPSQFTHYVADIAHLQWSHSETIGLISPASTPIPAGIGPYGALPVGHVLQSDTNPAGDAIWVLVNALQLSLKPRFGQYLEPYNAATKNVAAAAGWADMFTGTLSLALRSRFLDVEVNATLVPDTTALVRLRLVEGADSVVIFADEMTAALERNINVHCRLDRTWWNTLPASGANWIYTPTTFKIQWKIDSGNLGMYRNYSSFPPAMFMLREVDDVRTVV